MKQTVYNWDIEEMAQLKNEIEKLCTVLSENASLLGSEGFDLAQDWKGVAGGKFFFINAASISDINKLIESYTSLSEKLDELIKYYESCESEINSQIAKLSS